MRYNSAGVGTTQCVDGTTICTLQISASSDRYGLSRKMGKHQLSELFQEQIVLDNGCLQG